MGLPLVYHSGFLLQQTWQANKIGCLNETHMYTIHLTGIVVQLVRAPPCQGGSYGFEPRQSRTRILL